MTTPERLTAKLRLEIRAVQFLGMHRQVDAGIEDRQGKRAVFVLDRGEHMLHILGIGHVAVENDDAAGKPACFGLQFGKRFVIARGDGDFVPFTGQFQRQRSPDA